MSVVIPSSEMISVAELKVDGNNPNRMTPQQHEALRKSIEKYGFIVPIITNKDLLVADGEQRLTVAKDIGMSQVPVVRLPIEDVDRRLLRQVLNKLRGEHELLADAYEFDKIISMGKEQDLKELLLLSDSQIERYLMEIHEPKEETYEIPEIEKITTDIQRGDIYQLGKHRLMCGDATNENDVTSLIPSNFNMMFTDPPYGVDYASKNTFLNAVTSGYRIQEGIANDKQTIPEMRTLWTTAFKVALNHAQKGAPYYVCSPQGGELMMMMMMSIIEAGWQLKHSLIWVKNNIVLGRSDYKYQHEPILYGWKETSHKFYGLAGCSSVWEVDKSHNSDLHPTQKPTALIKRALFNSSIPNDTVYDGFGGSGSTLIACEQTNRICYMMEIEPRYVEIICRRWEAYTGQKAVKISENNVSKSNN